MIYEAIPAKEEPFLFLRTVLEDLKKYKLIQEEGDIMRPDRDEAEVRHLLIELQGFQGEDIENAGITEGGIDMFLKQRREYIEAKQGAS